MYAKSIFSHLPGGTLSVRAHSGGYTSCLSPGFRVERFRLEDERIPNIGDKNKQILYTWGILDASDVEESKIREIKGFGPVKIQSLLDWRQQKERQFRFDPLQPVDPRDLLALEQEITQKSTSMQSALKAGPATLRQSIGVWQAQRRQLLTNLVSSASQLARTQVDLNALRRF
jgi:DNA-binding helix-hairpin-helix protein with protein kinase domain